MTPSEKLAAGVANERLERFAGLLNSLAASASIGSLIAPSIAGTIVDPFWSVLIAGVGCLLHVFGQVVLDFLKSEQ